jgi:hypothetical protein
VSDFDALIFNPPSVGAALQQVYASNEKRDAAPYARICGVRCFQSKAKRRIASKRSGSKRKVDFSGWNSGPKKPTRKGVLHGKLAGVALSRWHQRPGRLVRHREARVVTFVRRAKNRGKCSGLPAIRHEAYFESEICASCLWDVTQVMTECRYRTARSLRRSVPYVMKSSGLEFFLVNLCTRRLP